MIRSSVATQADKHLTECERRKVVRSMCHDPEMADALPERAQAFETRKLRMKALRLKDETANAPPDLPTDKKVVRAFESVFQDSQIPEKLQTDAGKEFFNKTFEALMKKTRHRPFLHGQRSQSLCDGLLPVYELQDYDGEPIEGSFYKAELQKVKIDRDKMYAVEKMLKRHTIIQYQQVGDSYSPLLGVNVKGDFGDVVNIRYHTVHYTPVSKAHIKSIHIEIKTDRNRGFAIAKPHLKSAAYQHRLRCCERSGGENSRSIPAGGIWRDYGPFAQVERPPGDRLPHNRRQPRKKRSTNLRRSPHLLNTAEMADQKSPECTLAELDLF
ncbi:hypothetical protein L3Q82_005100 [Scortum barcoo]|uniref:Uncharacterized protein n=1 Tax=Scortum barcoo TaxID=214431 RepID=A0ACB8VF68_9TELE|nr:hypothetical protein L3Q82_005100 [Scortum barcoo]